MNKKVLAAVLTALAIVVGFTSANVSARDGSQSSSLAVQYHCQIIPE